MNGQDEPPVEWDQAEREELAGEHAEMEQEIEAELTRFHRLLDLLAWVLMSRRKDRVGHPHPSFFDEEAMRWLALHDPIFHASAREAMALMVQALPELADMDFVAELLVTPCPPRRGRGGEHLGRDLLIIALFDHISPQGQATPSGAPSWQFHGKWPAVEIVEPSANSLSLFLYAQLAEHPFLAEDEAAVPSPERLRQIWLNRAEFFEATRFPAQLSEIGWAGFGFLKHRP